MKMLTDLDMQGNAIHNADIDGITVIVTTETTQEELQTLYEAGKTMILDFIDEDDHEIFVPFLYQIDNIFFFGTIIPASGSDLSALMVQRGQDRWVSHTLEYTVPTDTEKAAWNAKAPLASPAFTGTPTAPTPASGDDSTKIATTAFVQDAVEGAGGVAKYTEILDEDPANPVVGQIYSGYDDKVVFTENTPLDFIANFFGVAFGNNKFVAIMKSNSGNMLATYSTDGINWVEDHSASMHGANHEITFGNDKFVAVGGSTVEHSFDGINWINDGGFANGSYNSVTFGNDKFVAVGRDYAAYSTNGINWVEVVTESSFNSVTFGNDKFVAIGGSSAYSFDGINWFGTGGFATTYNGVAFGNGKFVAVGNNGCTAYSTDGSNWVENTPLSSGIKYRKVAFGNGKFVAVGNTGHTAYSTDGINWVENEPLSSATAYNGVAFGNGKFVAVGSSGYTAYSDIKSIFKYFNGIDWLSYLDESDMPTVPTALSQLTDDSTHRLVTDTEKSAWNASDVVFITNANTIDEIRALFDAGKSVIFYDINNGRYAFLTTVSSNNYTFTTLYGYSDSLQSYQIVQYTVNSSGWSTTTISSDAASGSFRQSEWTGTSMAPTMTVNFAYVNTNSSGVTTGTVGFQPPSETYKRTVEWTLAFKAGTNCSMIFTPPSGYTIKWKDGTPTFTSGKYYEISFRGIIANKLIIAYVSETNIS